MFSEISKESIDKLLPFLCANNLALVDKNEFTSNPFMKVVVYEEKEKIIGYLNYSVLYDKAELNYIYVSLEYRNMGIGSKLIEYLLSRCKMCQNITLEVRNDNISAIKLYEKYGFKKVAVRKNYYQGIDGILMMYERGEENE